MSTLAIEFVLPILTALIAWFANAYRSRQKKEKDILDNVQRIVDMQNDHIKRCDEMLARREAQYRKLEEKYDHKVRAVKEAYDCEHDQALCPVLMYDKRGALCDDCELRIKDCKQ